MSLIQTLYSVLHRMATPRDGRDSSASPGYWNHMVRTTILSRIRGMTGTILDVGCGDGVFLTALARQNPQARIWAIDRDADCIRQAQERMQREHITTIHFVQQDATALSLGGTRFDAVVCANLFMVMDSVATVQRALSSIERVCNKGAVVFFDYRNAANPLIRLKYKWARVYDKTLKAGQYVNAYYPADMEQVLANAHMLAEQEIRLGAAFVKNIAPVMIVKARVI